MAPAVLVVEDDPDIRELVVLMLTCHGFDVVAVADGASALVSIAGSPPDLVVLDVMMPGLSGIDVCRRLRSEPATRHLPVILLTARAQDTDVELGLGVGANAYVTKPFGVRELLSQVHALLGHVRS